MRKVRAVLVLAAVLSGSMMAGCAGPGPRPPVAPSPSATPLFASDEEALAAAEAAYGEYLEVSDAIAADGGAGAERIAPFVTPEQLLEAKEDFAELNASGRRMDGRSSFDSSELQRSSISGIAVYLCIDVSGVRVLDLDGVDVTPIDRPSRVPLVVVFVSKPPLLLLDSSEVWEGSERC